MKALKSKYIANHVPDRFRRKKNLLFLSHYSDENRTYHLNVIEFLTYMSKLRVHKKEMRNKIRLLALRIILETCFSDEKCKARG